MKNSIILTLMLASLTITGQVKFEGRGIRVDSLNTPNGQNYLVLHPSENRMAFTEEQGGTGSENGFTTSDITFDDTSLSVTVFPDYLGSKGMLSPIGFTEEGILYSEVSFDKGIYEGKVKLAKGDKLEEVSIPFFKNKSPIQSGCLSKDGQYMILSLESNNTKGVEDLYILRRKAGGGWGEPKNMGNVLNTEFQEITPFLAEDNKTLFFATNGREGQGSFDLYYTVRQDDYWRNWSEPVNLGSQINTTGAETSFAYQDGAEWAYYVSSQDSDGYGDIMRIKFKEDIEEDTTEVEVIPIAEVPEPVEEKIFLNVVDGSTGQSIPAEFIAQSGNRIGANGVFEIDSLSNEEVEIKSPGYLPVILVLDGSLKVGENKVELASIAKGSVITLDHVLFQRGTAEMISGSEKELDLVVEVMNDNPDIKILLKGHTDNTGDPVKNVKLSEARVKAVKAYILDQGISPYRVSGKGYGGNEPIASNTTEETRKLNRRVEFEVLED